MAVYVDPPLFPFRGMMMCHLWADDVAELHAMADRLGLKRSWFQCPPAASWEHYDVSKSVRARAIRLGAIQTDRYGAAYFVAKRDGRADLVERVDALRARQASSTPLDLFCRPGRPTAGAGREATTCPDPERTFPAMISGRYVDTFADATHGMLEGASLNAPYAFHWVQVLRVEGDELVCTGAGAELRLPLKRRDGREFAEVTVRDPTFGPRGFKVAPFKGAES